MGIYLGLYLLSLALALASYFVGRKTGKRFLEDVAIFLTLLMMFFFIFALATKDPLERLLTSIPAFWQFLLTALGGAFTIWKVYLNPLKTKVYGMDREIGEIKTDVSFIKDDVHSIKQALFKGKREKLPA